MSSEPDDNVVDPGWDDLDADTKHELIALAETLGEDPSKVTRRDLLAGAGAVGAGALLGGGATQALSEPASASHGGGELGTSSNPFEMIHTEGLSALDSLSTDELNSVVCLDPDETDWPTAMNDALSRVTDGGTIFVPPLHYTYGSTVTVDKRVSIVSLSQQGNSAATTGDAQNTPLLEATADVPALETNAIVFIDGLAGWGDTASTSSPFIHAHGRIHAQNVTGYEMGTHVFYLEQAASGDNLNYSTLSPVSGTRCGGAVVAVENSSGDARNTNAMKIEVLNSSLNNYGVHIAQGFRNHVEVQHAAGSEHTAAIRFGSNGDFNYGKSIYTEGNVGAVAMFDGVANHVDIVETGLSLGNEAVYNTNNNSHGFLAAKSKPIIYSPQRTMKFGANDLEITDETGGGLVVEDADGSGDRYRIRVNGGTVEANGPL